MKTVNPNLLSEEIQYILECIDSIDQKYYKEEITTFRDGALYPTGEFRANESTYVNQLIKKIEERFKENSIHSEKYYQTDEPKQLIFKEKNYIEKYGQSFDTLFKIGGPEEVEFRKVPDIVIHSGPNDITHNNQIFLSEVKTTLKLTQALFNIDLFKVNVYHEELCFKNSAFIIINSTVKNIKKMYLSYRDNNYYETKRAGMFLIIKPSYNDKTEIFEL